MPTTILNFGKVVGSSFNHRGSFNINETYNKLDCVYDSSCLYTCLEDNTTLVPLNNISKWELILYGIEDSILGTKNIGNIGDGTLYGAISFLNTSKAYQTDLNSKLKKETFDANIGTTNISSIGDGTITGAINYIFKNGGNYIPLNLTNAKFINKDEAVSITWNDPNDATETVNGITKTAIWDGTIIVRKENAPPTSITDGVLILDNKIRNNYSSSGYVDTGLTNGTVYYYGIFPYSTTGIYTTDYIKKFIPKIIYPNMVKNITVSNSDNQSEISFDKASDITKVSLVYKKDSSPLDKNDGILIDDITSPLIISGLSNDQNYYCKFITYNEKNREKYSDEFVICPGPSTTFAEVSDTKLIKMIQDAYNGLINLQDYWKVGDSRIIHINAMNGLDSYETHDAKDIEIIILGFNHDDLVTPINGKNKSVISIGLKEALETRGSINVTDITNITKSLWKNCDRRTWCNTIFKNALPKYISDNIKTVKKETWRYCEDDRSYECCTVTNDDCFLLSQGEIRYPSSIKYGRVISGNFEEIQPQDGNIYSYNKYFLDGKISGINTRTTSLSLSPNSIKYLAECYQKDIYNYSRYGNNCITPAFCL